MISLVLSGGKGERLWPVSRNKWPKPFSPFFEECLFTQTVKRLSHSAEVWVCTSEVLLGMTESQIRQDKLNVAQCLYEPVGRNTAPAIALTLKVLEQQQKHEQVVGVFPADHWIEDKASFEEALKLAEVVAKENKIVTLGMVPTYPATGFGYIELQEKVSVEKLSALQVLSFREKPEQSIAEDFLKQGRFVWNSGIFVFKVDHMIRMFQQHMPDLWQSLDSLKPDLTNLKEVYQDLPSESIDYGIMEKADCLVNIPCEIGWSDLGSWSDLSTLNNKHPLKSHAETQDNGENNFIFSTATKNISVMGVDNLMVIDTPDALLISSRESMPAMRELVGEVKAKSPDLLDTHVVEHRPWGHYQNLYESPGRFKAKVIRVEPGQQLSYQSHKHRAEIWVTVSGVGEVVLDDQIIAVQTGVVVQIPQGAKHRMRNTSREVALEFVEVQLGDSFFESDIIRYSDDYKRS